MAKIVKKKHKNITILSNTIINDKRLGWKALGIFVFLWHLPNNWVFHENEIQTHSNRDGINSLRSGIKLLEDFKYLKIIRKRNKLGQMIKNGAVWYLNDNPHDMKTQGVGYQHMDNRRPGKRELLNTDNTKHLSKQNTDITNLPRNIFEKEFADIDKFVQRKWTTSIPNNKRLLISKLIVKFGYQQVKEAINTTYDNGIGINGMPNYVKAVVFSNQNKPKRKSRSYSYGHQPIKQHVPDWAKKGYHEKLHPTSKKLQRKIQKQLHDLKNRDDRN